MERWEEKAIELFLLLFMLDYSLWYVLDWIKGEIFYIPMFSMVLFVTVATIGYFLYYLSIKFE